MIQERRSPLFDLGFEDGLYRPLRTGRIYTIDSCHSTTSFLAMLL
jgi:hypothetical protein